MFESGMNNDDFDARAQSAAKDSDFEGKMTSKISLVRTKSLRI